MHILFFQMLFYKYYCMLLIRDQHKSIRKSENHTIKNNVTIVMYVYYELRMYRTKNNDKKNARFVGNEIL